MRDAGTSNIFSEIGETCNRDSVTLLAEDTRQRKAGINVTYTVIAEEDNAF
jgi:hypothetical protein